MRTSKFEVHEYEGDRWCRSTMFNSRSAAYLYRAKLYNLKPRYWVTGLSFGR